MTRRQIGALAALAFVIGLVLPPACAGPDPRRHLASVVSHSVDDPTQLRVMRHILKSRDADIDAYGERSERLNASLHRAFSSRDVGAAELGALLDQALEGWEVHQQRMILGSMQMRDLVGPNAWGRIADADMDLLLNSLQRFAD